MTADYRPVSSAARQAWIDGVADAELVEIDRAHGVNVEVDRPHYVEVRNFDSDSTWLVGPMDGPAAEAAAVEAFDRIAEFCGGDEYRLSLWQVEAFTFDGPDLACLAVNDGPLDPGWWDVDVPEDDDPDVNDGPFDRHDYPGEVA